MEGKAWFRVNNEGMSRIVSVSSKLIPSLQGTKIWDLKNKKNIE
jgi:hypothetical protein